MIRLLIVSATADPAVSPVFLGDTPAQEEYFCKQDLTKEEELPAPLLEYAQKAKSGEAALRRYTCLSALARLLRLSGLSCPPLTVGRYGKPDFAEGGYHFSLSHADGLCAAVLSDFAVGLDLEPCDRTLPDERISRLSSLFTPAERERLTSAPDRAMAFLETWVAKEAYCKWDGRGLAALRAAPDTLACPPTLARHLSAGGREYCLAVYGR
ncbi:MAG: 4'-phosphopantetheinyl transferase superfamily protein [Clostridia bacterium]|nr:4'-phosphopantetheinyl transferase superfamily protein [Clostridia bacterium]